MPTDKSDKPQRTVQFDTGMAMTLSCSPSRDTDALPTKRHPASDDTVQQRGTVK